MTLFLGERKIILFLTGTVIENVLEFVLQIVVYVYPWGMHVRAISCTEN